MSAKNGIPPKSTPLIEGSASRIAPNSKCPASWAPRPTAAPPRKLSTRCRRCHPHLDRYRWLAPERTRARSGSGQHTPRRCPAASIQGCSPFLPIIRALPEHPSKARLICRKLPFAVVDHDGPANLIDLCVQIVCGRQDERFTSSWVRPEIQIPGSHGATRSGARSVFAARGKIRDGGGTLPAP